VVKLRVRQKLENQCGGLRRREKNKEKCQNGSPIKISARRRGEAGGAGAITRARPKDRSCVSSHGTLKVEWDKPGMTKGGGDCPVECKEGRPPINRTPQTGMPKQWGGEIRVTTAE